MLNWLAWIGSRLEFWHLVVIWTLLTMVPVGMMIADRRVHIRAIRRRLDEINNGH